MLKICALFAAEYIIGKICSFSYSSKLDMSSPFKKSASTASKLIPFGKDLF